MAAPKRRERVFQNEQWNTCYFQFIASQPSESTRKSYHGILRNFFSDPKKPPSAYTRADVEAYISSPVRANNRADKGAPVSVNWRNNRLGVLCSFYTWCAHYHVTFRGKPAPIIRGIKPTDGVKQAKKPKCDRSITDEEIERFFAAIDRSTRVGKRDYCFFLLLLLTGRRKSEVLLIRWQDLVETPTGWIAFFQGKGHLTKDDVQPIPPIIMDALQSFLESMGKWGKMQPTDAVFLATQSWKHLNEPMNGAHINRRFAVYARAAHLRAGVCVHSFRGRNAWDRLQANGGKILEVQTDMRHRTLDVTLAYVEPYRLRQKKDTTLDALAAKYGHL